MKHARIGAHAVVLGGSMSGLLAARVLAEHYAVVTVVERDELGCGIASRRGVPQDRHGHALLARGLEMLEAQFPRITDEMVADGANVLEDGDMSRFLFCFNGHWMATNGICRDPKALKLITASRPFIEGHVRGRLRAIENVTFLDGHQVDGLTSTADRTRVTGVRITQPDGDERTLTADLVIDATGRGSRTPAFLDDLGYGRPREDQVFMHMAYTSQLLQLPAGLVKQDDILVGPTPGRLFGGALWRYEKDTWMLTWGAMMGMKVPEDRAGILDFLQPFAPEPMLAAVREGVALSPVARHKVPSSRWRRYDKMRRFPAGLLVSGDAICSFNPIYGQGMTVGALDALSMGECLRHGDGDLARRYFRATAKHITRAWQLATGSDLVIPEVQGPRPLAVRVAGRYTDRALATTETNTYVAERFLRVINFVDTPNSLLKPDVMLRVAATSLKRRRSLGAARRSQPQTISS